MGALEKGLFIDPHQAACLVGLDLILDAVEIVAKLTVLPLVVVVELHLPDGLKHARIFELVKGERWEGEISSSLITHIE